MAQTQHTTAPRSFKHLRLDQRGMIAAYHDQGLSTRQVGDKIGCSHSTVSRELRRGTVKQRNSDLIERYQYFPDAGQRVYEENRSQCGTRFKAIQVSDFLNHAQKMLSENKWSPDAIVGEYRLNPKTKDLPCVCTNTLYQYIDMGLLSPIKNIDLLQKVGRKRRKVRCRKNKRILGDSIEVRPPEISKRKTLGHWEIDTVVGTRSKGKSLLTILERKSRTFLIRPLAEHTTECVNEAIRGIQEATGHLFPQIFKTITADNGSEFYGLTEQLTALGSKAFFCHPYSSWEKGGNEKHNSLIRRFLPKGTSFADLTSEDIARIQNWCNNLPRKILGYRTPLQVFEEEILATA
jgi:IS30 family transposase